MKLTFLGAAGAVTGSKYLVELDGRRVLLESGLFQGLKRLRERNWQPLALDPQSLDAVLLTHAHIDHSGYLPVLVHSGYRGPVYCTEATRRLLSLMLPDAARLQEEEAEYANRHRFSKHSPALPLYTEADARAALERLHPVALPSRLEVCTGIQASFSRAGHLLGAASIRLESRSERILFSGDLGCAGLSQQSHGGGCDPALSRLCRRAPAERRRPRGDGRRCALCDRRRGVEGAQ